MKKKSGIDICEANKDKLVIWLKEGKSYFWMAKEIGLGERNFAVVSKWFISYGVFKKKELKNGTCNGQY